MSGELHILGIRHHGPGSARMVSRALRAIKPDAVLIEGPADAADVVPLAAAAEMVPPVAILVYDPQAPSDASFYPFAEFSPEWQAIRWGLNNKAEVRFIDLPQSLRPRRVAKGDAVGEQDGVTAEAESLSPAAPRPDPLEALAHAAGFADGEAWWGRLIEERRGDDRPLEVFEAISEAMGSARAELGPTPHDPDEPAREAHMRRSIRAAIKEGYERIAVVCGAWHAPVLTAGSLKSIAAKSDEEIIKRLTKHKTAATWVPWTYDRLAYHSGYGAGVTSPGWYEHLWLNHDQITAKWLTKVARFMREEDLEASPASVIESVRLAESLAALRGRSIAGLDELSEATLSILCHGNPLPMRVIEQKLIVGNRLGEIPDHAPSVPLQRDLTAQQKSLRMKVSADGTELDLDLRKETDGLRSRLLHRLAVLGIPWGSLTADQKQRSSTFHEVWALQWKPEFAVAVIEAARWGNTVHDAAAACVQEQAERAGELSELTRLLDHVMLADLPGAIDALISRIQTLSAVAASIGGLMDALPPLARILRYGNVRKTDAALVEPLVAGLLARICAGLLPACGSLDDDAAEEMLGRLDAVSAALHTLARAEFTEPWRAELRKLGDADIHGLIAGRAWRVLLDAQECDADLAAARIALALSPGNDPGQASAWVEGFLSGSGAVLVHDARLLAIIDRWVCSLPAATFEQVCPIARRTFSTFARPERRMIGESLKRGLGATQQTASEGDDDYDPARGRLVDPVLRLILGEVLP
ncbi:MAG: hypothetical protein JSR77_15640 [Planctomycetes bacterium]|nr:hypothetical protein [Planctomycetota bacterium]